MLNLQRYNKGISMITQAKKGVNVYLAMDLQKSNG